MTTEQKLKKVEEDLDNLKETVRTMIIWQVREFGEGGMQQLLEMTRAGKDQIKNSK